MPALFDGEFVGENRKITQGRHVTVCLAHVAPLRCGAVRICSQVTRFANAERELPVRLFNHLIFAGKQLIRNRVARGCSRAREDHAHPAPRGPADKQVDATARLNSMARNGVPIAMFGLL